MPSFPTAFPFQRASLSGSIFSSAFAGGENNAMPAFVPAQAPAFVPAHAHAPAPNARAAIVHKALVLLLLILAGPAALVAQEAWELKKDKSGIQVFVREKPGESLKESKSTVQFSASIDAIVDAIFDYSRYDEWAPRHMEARVVEKPTDNVIVSYSLNDSPWPVSNRDIVMENTIHRRADGSVRIDMEALDGSQVDARSGVVRITQFTGHYLLEPKPGGQVKVTYQAHLDPGGSIPAWMANMAVVDTPYDLLFQLRRQVSQ